MRILVTNDDGISSPGLGALAGAVAAAGHQPVVAAPSTDWSGASACLGPIDDPGRVAVNEVGVGLPDGGSLVGFSVAAPPALITMLASLGGFGDPPKAVVAGINRGPNTGRSTLFSGTIGAVLAGERFGWSGLAVSLDVAPSGNGDLGPHREPHWQSAADLAETMVSWMVEAPPRTVLNLNVPDRPTSETRGLRWADLAPVGGVRTVITGRDEVGLRLDLVANDLPVPEGSDSDLLRNGWATVTSLVPTHAASGDLPLDEWATGWRGRPASGGVSD